MPSPAELLVILGIVVLLFGAKKLPELARSMGKASREFRKGAREADEDEQAAAPRAEDTTPS
jgi:sec-independent protein translocase protein TatA